MLLEKYINRKKINKWLEVLLRAFIKHSHLLFLKSFVLRFIALDSRLLKFIDDPNDYRLSVGFIVDVDDRLDLAWVSCEFSKFEDIYLSSEKKISPENTLRYFYLKSDYPKFKECVEENSFLNKDLYKLYFSLILSHEPAIFYDKVKEIRSEINSPKFEMVKELYYRGCVKEAEQYRMSVANSAHDQITKFNQSNTDLDLKSIVSGNVKVIFIPEQGVGDEVRWSRLYHYLDYDNVTFACDERLAPVFGSYINNARLLSIKSLYSSRGEVRATIQELLKSLGTDDVFEMYDCIYTNCSIFSILPKNLIKTQSKSFLSKTTLRKRTKKIKVGVAWSSAVRKPMRSSRFGLPLHELVDVLPDYVDKMDFYAIQSGMTEDETFLCEAFGVKLVEHIDFYNDFKSSAGFYSALDAVVGVSTLNTELAAAVGPKFYHIANAPDIFYMRTGSLDDGCFNPDNHADQLSNNAKTIGPRIGYENDKTSINKSCFRHALDEILKDSSYDKKVNTMVRNETTI